VNIEALNITNEHIIATKADAFGAGIFWPLELTDKQETALTKFKDNTIDFINFGGAAGGGKSWIIGEAALWASLAYPLTRWFIGRKELKILRASTLQTFFKVCQKHKIPKSLYKYNGKDNFIAFKNGSRIDLIDLKLNPSDPFFEDLGSTEYTGGFIEEGGEVPFEAFDTLKARIGRQMNEEYNLNGTILITCNPKKNWLYRDFYKPFTKNELPKNYAFIQAFVNDNSFIDSGYIENLQSIKDKVKRERLLFGNWEYDNDPNRLIEDNHINDLFTNAYVKRGAKALTADIAFQGSDLFVCGYWEGQRLEAIVIIERADADEIEQAIRHISLKFGVRRSAIVYDADGIGSFLKGYLRGAKPFQSNARPVKQKGEDNYLNMSNQVAFKTAKKIREGDMYINPKEFFTFEGGGLKRVNANKYLERIREELEQIREKPSDEGKKRLVSKKDIKARLGYSPDFWDMLKMREFLNLKGRLKMA
jgi:hypothetical protein